MIKEKPNCNDNHLKSKNAEKQRDDQYEMGLIDEKDYQSSVVGFTDDMIELVQSLKRTRYTTKDIAIKTGLSQQEVKNILSEYGVMSVKNRVDKIIGSSSKANEYIFSRCGFEPEELDVLAKAKKMLLKKTHKAKIDANTNDAYELLPLAREAVKEMLQDPDLKFKALGVQMLSKSWDNVLTADCDVSDMKNNTNDIDHKLKKKRLEEGKEDDNIIPVQVIKLEGKFIEDDSEFDRKLRNRKLLLEDASKSNRENNSESTESQKDISQS